MGHKTLIGGTAYEIKGGKTLIGGTAYDIKGGKTLIGGTGFDISFAQREQTLPALMAAANLIDIAGRNSSSTGTVSLTLPAAGTYYILSFCEGYMSVSKVIYDGSSCTNTVLAQISGGYTRPQAYVSGGTVYYSNNGTGSATVRGATLAVFQFDDYTETEADAIFAAATYTRRAGRNSSSTGNVGGNGTFSNPATLFIATNNLVAFSTVAMNEDDMVYYSNCADNPSMATAPGKWGDGYTIYLSLAANKARASVYGASMIEVS